MRKLVSNFVAGPLACALVLALGACHADKNDPAGQAEELHDPVRRHNAINNLTRIYNEATSCCEKVKREDGTERCVGIGDEEHPEIAAKCKKEAQKIRDTIHKDLTEVYINHPEDTSNGKRIMKLINQMRDSRTLPALTEALDWRTEVTEDHAILAAKTIQHIKVPDDKVSDVVDALSKALDKISGARGVDNRMRINFIRALGSLESAGATKTLMDIVTTQSEEQDFLINRLAARELGELGDRKAIPTLIKGLFMFDPNNPGRRMNDVAAEGLVRIGRPAYEPVVKVLRGKHEGANKMAKQYIKVVAQKAPQRAKQMSVEGLVSQEATYTLGALGFRDAMEPLMNELESDAMTRRLNAAVALVRLNYKPSEASKVRDALKSVYEDAPVKAKPQLIAAMRHMYDPELLSFLLDQVKDDDLVPQVRLQAVKAYALLANGDEAGNLRRVIENEPKSSEGGYREKFAMFEPALQAAEKCDESLSCWEKRLDKPMEKIDLDLDTGDEGDEDSEKAKKKKKEAEQKKLRTKKLLLQKSAYMLGRLGRGKQKAIDALVEQLDHDELRVRLAAVQALDRVAVDGSEEAVKKIAELREQEQGRAIWKQFSQQALPIQARLRSRAS